MYTWNSKWIWDYESAWGIANKFMLANSVQGKLAALAIAGPNSHENKNMYYRYYQSYILSNYRFDNIDAHDFDIINTCNKSVDMLLKPFTKQISNINNPTQVLEHYFYKYFKYCPICLESGYHSILHQLIFLDTCIIHNVNLQSTCINCGSSSFYEINFKENTAAFCCPNCKKTLVNKSFDNLIDDWNRGFNFPFIPFKNKSEIFLMKCNDINRSLGNDFINKIIKELFYSKKISEYPVYSCCKSDKNRWSDLTFSNTINNNIYFKNYSERAFYIAFRICGRRFRKSMNINSNKLKKFECNVMIIKDIYNSNIYREKHHKNSNYDLNNQNWYINLLKQSDKVFNTNYYIYYVWKNHEEPLLFQHDNEYSIILSSKYGKHFRPDYIITNILERLENSVIKVIGNEHIDVLMDILVTLSLILLIKKHNCIEEEFKKIANENRLNLLISLRNSNLVNNIVYNDILIILEQNFNYKIYFDNKK